MSMTRIRTTLMEESDGSKATLLRLGNEREETSTGSNVRREAVCRFYVGMFHCLATVAVVPVVYERVDFRLWELGGAMDAEHGTSHRSSFRQNEEIVAQGSCLVS